MYLITKGIAVGFSIAAPVGAIGLLCIQQTLNNGIVVGIACGLGAATADMMYGIIVALGLKVSQTLLLTYKTPLTIIGGLFLCYLGIKKFFSVPTKNNSPITSNHVLKSYIVTFFLTLTNPATILDFMALFASLNINITGYNESLTFVGGVFLGSSLWWLLLCFTIGLFRKKISTQLIRFINYAAGVVIFAFGIYALSGLYR